MKRFLVGLTLFLVILVFLGGSNTNGMTILTDEKMASIQGASKLTGTESYCIAAPTCIPNDQGIETCVKLPTSLPRLQPNDYDNMSTSGNQCGRYWNSSCTKVYDIGCGGYLIDSVDP
ncbi:MAG: hypothetical protein ACP5QS_07470 [bacterium]